MKSIIKQVIRFMKWGSCSEIVSRPLCPRKFIRLRPEAFDELHVVAPIEQWTISAVVQIHEADSSLR